MEDTMELRRASGPEHWGDLDPDYAACKVGKEQSPIDMRNAKKTQLPAIRFEYKSGPLKIINNGYTAVRVNYAPGNGNFLFMGDQSYELTQFHFHHPSEESIHGKPYDMVAQWDLPRLPRSPPPCPGCWACVPKAAERRHSRGRP
jgi:carbonic anhydrase